MRTHDLARAAKVVEEALDLPGSKRQFYLEDLSLDTELRRKVEIMLGSEVRWDQMLDQPLLRLQVGERPDPNDWIGRRIGAYRIVKLVGQGGMGTVYLAERDDAEFSRQVAIKIVRGSLSPEARDRFASERQVLAGLEHPSIARLYDGGTTEEGIPYLVMEYVDGEPIDRFCDRKRLALEDRLRLLMSVFSAVAYAHNNLIVHRDIKAQNILVTSDGSIKLLDFGIAKVLGPFNNPSSRSSVTGSARSEPMTPSHASPEQILGEPVTTSADVYALGVVSYRLLTGLSPNRTKSANLADLERAIVEQEPLSPSEALTLQRADALQQVADQRSSTPPRLRRKLRGDLDAIVLRTLRKLPAERYATTASLAEDVDCYLNLRPVRARGSNWRYRSRMFARRHSVGTSLAALTAVLLLGLAITLGVLSTRVARQRDLAQHQRLQSEAISDFLVEVLQTSGSEGSDSDQLASRILARGSARVDEMTRYPSLQAAYLHSVGKVLLDLGRYGEAEELADRAVQIRQHLYGKDSLETVESQNVAATIYQKQARYEEAELLFRHVLSARESKLGEHHPDTAMARNNLGLVLWREGQFEEAEWLLREALETSRSRLGNHHPGVLAGLSNLALVLQARGDLDAAEQLHRETLNLAATLFGTEHLRFAIASNNLAMLLIRQDRVEEAERHARRSLRIQRSLLGDNHPSVARAMHNLAKVLRNRGELIGAADLFQNALAIRRETLGVDHPDVLRSSAELNRTRVLQDLPTPEPPIAMRGSVS